MQQLILSTILAFFVTFFAIPVIIQIAKSKKLFDEPDERKVHKAVIPTLGGLGIFAGFIVATLMGAPTVQELQYFAAAAIVIFFLGIKDDILVLSANKKFIGQLIAAGIVMKFGGLYIDNMHGFIGIHNIPYYASVFLTIFTIIVITNSFNLIDGVDGLAGSLGLLTSVAFGIYFYLAGELAYAVMALSLSGAILGFLIYNFSPAKIFMGDTGSLLIGLINSILVIKFINVAGGTTNAYALNAAPALGFAILMIPLFDTLRVFGLRISKGRSPFNPDRIHIHHYLLDLGFSHKKITLSLGAAAVGFMALAFAIRHLNCTAIVAILLLTGFLFIGIIYMLRKNLKSSFNEPVKEKEIRTTHKIFNLVPETAELD
ncbi:glycosyltransferase family 4 protein [Ferruginibacter yonginensis]|uniref:Glycosyltransferase family 4 protein n=1 Tax=Ferruginibacter yonginensis TaxID=1310416 RepID=A0ABV8QU58_9BACT